VRVRSDLFTRGRSTQKYERILCEMSDRELMDSLDDLPLEGEGSADGLIAGMTERQDAEARRYAMEFLAKVVRLRGVKIDRECYLRQELHKFGVSEAQVMEAIERTPVQAGVALPLVDEVASASIEFETRKSALVSFTAGLPGGAAMLATVPGDVVQYYVHAFRVMQKLSYLYGWKDFLGDLDESDDETIGKLTLFLGVMMGVGGASASLSRFAQQVARPAVEKQVAKQALTKTSWYQPMKKTLAVIGLKVTKSSFGRTVSKAVPVVGGLISGGMTLVSLKSQSERLRNYLRELPPPGVDASDYARLLRETDDVENADDPGMTGDVDGATVAVEKSGARAGRRLLPRSSTRWLRRNP